MLPYIRQEYKRLAIVTIASIAIALASAVQPQIFKLVLDELIKLSQTHASFTAILPLLLLLGITSLIYALSSNLFNIYADRVFINLQESLRQKLFMALTEQSVDYFETDRPGAIMQRSTNALGSFVGWVQQFNYGFLGPIFTVVFVVIMLSHKSPWLGINGLAVLIYTYFDFNRTRKKSVVILKRQRAQDEIAFSTLGETITHFSTIVSTSHINVFRKKFVKATNNARKEALLQRKVWNRSLMRRTVFNEVSYLIAMTTAVLLVLWNRATPGDLLAIVTYFGMIRSNARDLARVISVTDDADVDAGRLLKIFDREPTIKDKVDAIPLRRLESIKFEHVYFSYPENSKGAIENISFRIDATNSIALVGPSGVGKSTITKILLRFYEPTSGEILINDQPADTYTIESVRSQIGMVMQDVALFNTTVKENLKLANTKATKADLEDAAEQSHAAEFIEELPKQYNTIVGERGVKLSGGQKQRIAIARAILRNPDLIILDEATSALDSESERLVQAGLKKLMQGRLSLTIAHRLSTVRHADEILVLKQGKIAERGTHDELMRQKSGLYRRLFELQSATGEVQL